MFIFTAKIKFVTQVSPVPQKNYLYFLLFSTQKVILHRTALTEITTFTLDRDLS